MKLILENWKRFLENEVRDKEPGQGGVPPTPTAPGKRDGDPCWDGYKQEGTKMKGGKQVPNCVPLEEGLVEEYQMVDASYEDGGALSEDFEFYENLNEEELQEAVYQGKTVKLNKPTRGDVKKFKVYVNSGKKDSKGRVKAKKVNFGDKKMRIKKSNPKRRKSFRARHNCDNPGPKTKARYWSCKKW